MLRVAMRFFLPLTLLLSSSFALSLAGCTVESACTEEARSSVTVEVVDASGAPVLDATVTYSVGGAAAKACENTLMNGSYVCGYEETGDFTITVTRGAETKTQTLTVTADECHVIGKNIQIKLGA